MTSHATPGKVMTIIVKDSDSRYDYMIGLQSIGAMQQFHSQHYRHPAVDSRVVIPSAMTITDSTHQPLASIWHFVSHKVSCMTSTTLNHPPPPSSRIVTLVWSPSLTFECDVIYGRPLGTLSAEKEPDALLSWLLAVFFTCKKVIYGVYFSRM